LEGRSRRLLSRPHTSGNDGPHYSGRRDGSNLGGTYPHLETRGSIRRSSQHRTLCKDGATRMSIPSRRDVARLLGLWRDQKYKTATISALEAYHRFEVPKHLAGALRLLPVFPILDKLLGHLFSGGVKPSRRPLLQVVLDRFDCALVPKVDIRCFEAHGVQQTHFIALLW
jgi:hypothetical protein